MLDGRDTLPDILIDAGRRTGRAAAVPDDGGPATVPRKPSAEMLAAGTRAGEVSVETAWRVYQAMVAEADRTGGAR